MTSPFLPEYRYFPDDPRLAQRENISAWGDMSSAVNSREIGIYSTAEQNTGKKLFPSSSGRAQRDILRKVFSIGNITAGTTSTTAHSISGLSLVVELKGTVITATPDFRPIPFVSTTALNVGIELYADATNIYIVVGAGSANITSALVIMEYIR